MMLHKKKDVELAKEIFARAVERMEMGRYVYGDFDPATDTRDTLEEAELELIDTINYLIMEIGKLRYIRSQKRVKFPDTL